LGLLLQDRGSSYRREGTRRQHNLEVMMDCFDIFLMQSGFPSNWPEIIEAASKNPLGILALIILVLGILGYIYFKDAAPGIKVAMFIAMLGGAVGYGAVVAHIAIGNSSYRVRVTVIDAKNAPVSDAKVWSSVGGEPQRVEGGWLFVIASDTKPLEGKVIFYASREATFETGEGGATLADDHNPTVILRLGNPRSASVIGIVTDEQNSAIEGATVIVIGYDSEAVVTKMSGSFLLPAHAADGQQVQVHARKNRYKAATQWCPAGNSPCSVVLRH
jgi:hypothetical protein